jgi:hypothetical protein
LSLHYSEAREDARRGLVALQIHTTFFLRGESKSLIAKQLLRANPIDFCKFLKKKELYGKYCGIESYELVLRLRLGLGSRAFV